MIIGIDASRANERHKTGTEWCAYYIIETMKKLGSPHDRFVLYSREPLRGGLANLPDNFTSRILHWPPRFLWTQLRLAWEMLIHPPEVLFVPAHTMPIFAPSRTFVILHDIGFEYFKHFYSKQAIGPKNKLTKIFLGVLVRILTFGRYRNTELDYHRWSTRLALKKAKKVITVSKFSQREIINRFHVSSDRLVIIPNSFNVQYHYITDRKLINNCLVRYGIQRPFALFIGRVEEKKNIKNIIKAFLIFIERHSEYELIFAGKPGYGYDKIKQLITEVAAQNKVRLLGWVSEDDLPLLLNAAAVFLFPTLYEGFGLPVLESMNCHTPVITSRNTAAAEIAGGAALLVNPEDPRDIAIALSRLAKDTALVDSLIRHGIIRAKKFSWETSTRAILQLITRR